MNNKYKHLIGGESYSLSDLFSGENEKVVIPDLQRDYCWGNEDVNLVAPFIDTLISLDRSQNLTMGLIYGYFDEICPNYLQLCDGQQRLTTLFLILGVLNRMTSGRYKGLLMSQYELMDDDNEPYLLYSIRESSLYFISDLVYHYFFQIEESDKCLNLINDIESCPWFLNSYKTDPTISSIMSAIITIEQKLQDKSPKALEELGDYIAGVYENKPHIEFLFYDMKNRHNGEETFVVINTTGEPLTASQNLKPIVIGYYHDTIDNIEEKWEEMETWFWQHRDKSAKIHTSDEGMSEFLRCARLYYVKDTEDFVNSVDSKERFPYESISFTQIYNLFQIYCRIYDIDYRERNDSNLNYNNKNNHGRYSMEQLYSILPTLKYAMCFDANDEDIRRFYHVFYSISKYQSVSIDKNKDGKVDIPVMRAMAIVDDMKEKDVLCLRESSKLNDQETAKLTFIHNNKNNREQAEQVLVKAEKIKLFSRRIKTIIDWCDNSIEHLKFYIDRINSLWTGNYDSNIDSLRRALLTCDWTLYPIPVDNKTHKTLGWEWSDWYTFFTKNDLQVKDFLESDVSLEERIALFNDKNSPYYSIIKNEEYIKASNRKILYDYGNIVILMEKERAQANYCIFMNGVPYPKNELGGGWKTPWRWGDLLYCDHAHYDLTIDYLYDDINGYKILIWSGKHKSHIPFNQLPNVQQFGLESYEKGTDGWISQYIKDAYQAKELVLQIAKWVDNSDNSNYSSNETNRPNLLNTPM